MHLQAYHACTPSTCHALRRSSRPAISNRFGSSLAKQEKHLSPEHKQLFSLTYRMMNAAVKRDRDPSWNYHKTKGGEELRLKHALHTSQNPLRVASLEKTQFFAERQIDNATIEELLDTTASKLGSEPGSFVELRRNGLVTHGIVVGTTLLGGPLNTLSLITTGEVWTHRITDIMFAIPGFVDAELMKRCGTEEVATDGAKSAARLQVLKRARDFERAVEATYNSVGQSITQLFPRVKSSHPDQWSKITTIQAARVLDVRPNTPVLALFAVHKHLMARSREFLAHPTAHRQTHEFDVRPQAHIDNIRTVTSWVQSRDSVLHNFAQKAQDIIDSSRALTKCSTGELPSQAEVQVTSFSSSDLSILQFLQHSLRSKRTTQTDPYAAFVPLIIKRIDRYEGSVESEVVQRLLSEVGVYTPWEDMASKEKVLNVYEETEGEAVQRAADEMHLLENSSLSGPTFLRPEDHRSCDLLDSVRHDFGDMPVYVIDDAEAQELDDGISYEAIPNEPECAWIHVHIADPTAFIGPSDEAARHARRRLESVYFIHRTWPMLPTSFMKRGLSLGSLVREGLPQNVLTFSCKVNGAGDLIGYDIRAGLIKNVHTITYDDVNALLELPSDTYATLPFEAPDAQPSAPVPSNLADLLPHREHLEVLWKFSQKKLDLRRKSRVFAYSQPKASVSISPKPLPQNPVGISTPVLYRGFPRLSYSVTDYRNFETGARLMVAECMKLVGRVASRFCDERGLPAIRRAADPIQVHSEEELEKLLALRNELNYVDALEVLKVGVRISEARYTLEPAGHWGLDIPNGEGYVRVTSPLRRYQDMVAHWQIKHALLPRSILPFSADNLRQLISEMTLTERLLKKTSNMHQRYWTHLYVRRFMEDRKSLGSKANHDPLRSIDGFTASHIKMNHTYNHYNVEVWLPSLGLIADLILEKPEAWDLGTPLKVTAKHVALGLDPRLVVTLV